MPEKIKAPILILIFFVFIAFFTGVVCISLLQKERAKNTVLQGQLDNVNGKLKISESKLEEARKAVSTLQSERDQIKAQIDELTAELNKEKTTRQEAVTQLEQLKTDIEAYKSAKADLESKLNQAQDELKKIKGQVGSLQGQKKNLETQIQSQDANQEKSVELGKIVVSPETPADTANKGAVATGLKGEVLVVNKEYNFAVINLGAENGVNENDVFLVYHGNNYIGDIKVQKVHEAMSAADFATPEDLGSKINKGDKVVQKKG